MAVVLLRAVCRRTFPLGPPGRVPGRELGRETSVFGRLLLEGRFEAEGRLETPVRAEGLERFDWDARLVEPDRAGLDRLTLELVFGLRLPPR